MDASKRPVNSNHPDKNERQSKWGKTKGKSPSNAIYTSYNSDSLKSNKRIHHLTQNSSTSYFLENVQSLIAPLINKIVTKNDN